MFLLCSCCADADGVGLTRNTRVANIDVVTARGEELRQHEEPNAMLLLPVLL